MKQREQYVVRETTTTSRKDYENSRKSMQSTGTWEMEVLRSPLNPEEMDDTELLKDLSSLGKPPSFDGKDTMLINSAVDTRETSMLESSGQKYRKEILPLVEHVLARRLGARVNEHHKAIREMDNQVMPHIQYTDKVADESIVGQRQVSPRTTETKQIFKLTVNICKQRIFKLIDLAQEIIGVKVAQKTWAQVAQRCFNEGGSRGRHCEQQQQYHISCQPNDTE